MSMSRGTIKRLVRDKGFGFIAGEGRSDDQEYFFHRSAVATGRFEDLSEGDTVEFEPQKSQKGMRAENVSRA